MGVGSERHFGIIIGPLLIVIAGLAHAGFKSCQTSGGSGSDTLLVIILVP